MNESLHYHDDTVIVFNCEDGEEYKLYSTRRTLSTIKFLHGLLKNTKATPVVHDNHYKNMYEVKVPFAREVVQQCLMFSNKYHCIKSDFKDYLSLIVCIDYFQFPAKTQEGVIGKYFTSIGDSDSMFHALETLLCSIFNTEHQSYIKKRIGYTLSESERETLGIVNGFKISDSAYAIGASLDCATEIQIEGNTFRIYKTDSMFHDGSTGMWITCKEMSETTKEIRLRAKLTIFEYMNSLGPIVVHSDSHSYRKRKSTTSVENTELLFRRKKNSYESEIRYGIIFDEYDDIEFSSDCAYMFELDDVVLTSN